MYNTIYTKKRPGWVLAHVSLLTNGLRFEEKKEGGPGPWVLSSLDAHNSL